MSKKETQAILKKYENIHVVDLMDKVHEELGAILLKISSIDNDVEWNAVMDTFKQFVQNIKEYGIALNTFLTK